MTYSVYETSTQDGAPIELYEFRMGTTYYRYTNAEQDISTDGFVWSAIPIKRSGIEATTEQARLGVTVTVARDHPIADIYRIAPPSDIITLTIFRRHQSDPDAEAITLWTGRLLNVKWPGGRAQILCEPVFTSLKRPGLRRLYQRSCPHALYSPACGVLPTAHELETTMTAVSGPALTVPGAGTKPDGYFAGGYMYVPAGASSGAERRMIVSHVGDAITLEATVPGLAANTTARFYPGCGKTLGVCAERFGNTDNYGGFPWIPGKNPFSGDPIF